MPVTRASSFADPADVRAFLRCKSRGKSDLECFKVGDNGEGCFGDFTATDRIAMCALPPQDMEERWGSVARAKHKKVLVTLTGAGGKLSRKSVVCIVADRMPRKPNSSGAGIDLNPGAAKALGLSPPFLVNVEWRWAE
jgi:hypothetical protein